MDFIKDTYQTIRRMNVRQLLSQGVQLGKPQGGVDAQEAQDLAPAAP